MKRGRPEANIQAACADYLDRMLDPYNSYYTSIGHGGGGVVRGKLLKRLGMKRGLGDMLICWRRPYGTPGIGWIELKSPQGRQSPDQRDFAAQMRWLYHQYAVVRSLDELIAVLAEWGVPTRSGKLQGVA